VGGQVDVHRYLDDTEEFEVDILDAADRPDLETTTFATIGLSGHTIGRVLPGDREVRVEFIGACGTEWVKVFGSAVSSCAFEIIKNHSSCQPGTVYLDIVGQYDRSLTMKHVMFVPPYLWPKIPDMVIKDSVVTWLQPVPISDEELRIREDEGADALERLFEAAQIDVYDLNRPSVRAKRRRGRRSTR
jgi:hypothetical protein